ncbi:unnamed protein product [Prunus armeniaca]
MVPKMSTFYFELAIGQVGGLYLDHRTGLTPEEEDKHATRQFDGLNLDHRTGLEGESQQDESQHYFEHATGRFRGLYLNHRTGLAPEEEDNVKSLFLHGIMIRKMSTFILQKEMKLHATRQFDGWNLEHHTGLEGESQQDESQHVSGVLLGRPEEEDDVKSLFLHGKMYFEHATGQFGGLYFNHRTGLAPEEEDNVKSLFLHGKMIRKMSTFILQKEMKFENSIQFDGLNLDHHTGLEGESQQDESQHVSGILLGRPEEDDDVKSLFLHGKMYFEHATGQFGGLYLNHRTGLAPEEEDNVKSLFLHGKMIRNMTTFILHKEMKLHAAGQFGGFNLDHRTGLEGESKQDESQHVSGVLLCTPKEEDDFGGLYLNYRTGLAPGEEDNVKSLFLHGKMIRKMSTFILQKEMKLYFEPATGQFVGLYLDHRTGLKGESEQDESTDVSGVPENMDLSDNGDEGEDNTMDEGGDDTEDEGSGGDEFGFNGGGDGGDSSSDGGPM